MKEQEYAFLRSTMPQSSKKKSRSYRTKWRGLNMSATSGSGYITRGQNFIVTADGTVRAADVPASRGNLYSIVNVTASQDPSVKLWLGRDDYIYAIVFKYDTVSGVRHPSINIARMARSGNTFTATTIIHPEGNDGKKAAVIYNKWNGGSDIVDGEYEKKFLLMPNKLEINGSFNDIEAIGTTTYYQYTTVTEKTVVNTYSGLNFDKEGTYPNYRFKITGLPDSTVEGVPTVETTEIHQDTPWSSMVDTKTTQTSDAFNYTEDEMEILSTLVVTTTETVTEIKYKTVKNVIPIADDITVYNTRVFGIKGSKIFASASNTYDDYDLDTATDIDETNAWYSASAEGGDFTALTVFGGRVTAFKENAMYELFNNKNPFRIKESVKVGTFSKDSIAETGNRLYFASYDGIYTYGGSYANNISSGIIDIRLLDGKQYTKAIGGAHGGKYIVRANYTENYTPVEHGGASETLTRPCFVFDSTTGYWSVLNWETMTSGDIEYFTNCGSHQYAVDSTGEIYQLDTGSKETQKWFFETPIECDDTANMKVLEKIQAVFNFYSTGVVKVSVKYDNGLYEEIGRLEKTAGVYPLYCKLTRGDHVARFIRFDFVGDVEVVTLEQILSDGGERFV